MGPRGGSLVLWAPHKGLSLPFDLEIYIRLQGAGFHLLRRILPNLETRRQRSEGEMNTFLSTPGVLRPELIWQTCRTARSLFDCPVSNKYCRPRTALKKKQ
jgi:hypothetical protein